MVAYKIPYGNGLLGNKKYAPAGQIIQVGGLGAVDIVRESLAIGPITVFMIGKGGQMPSFVNSLHCQQSPPPKPGPRPG